MIIETALCILPAVQSSTASLMLRVILMYQKSHGNVPVQYLLVLPESGTRIRRMNDKVNRMVLCIQNVSLPISLLISRMRVQE